MYPCHSGSVVLSRGSFTVSVWVTLQLCRMFCVATRQNVMLKAEFFCLKAALKPRLGRRLLTEVSGRGQAAAERAWGPLEPGEPWAEAGEREAGRDGVTPDSASLPSQCCILSLQNANPTVFRFEKCGVWEISKSDYPENIVGFSLEMEQCTWYWGVCSDRCSVKMRIPAWIWLRHLCI